ncbi:MAG: type II 3-dehydroquinate dehydratase [Paludibacteraceae bacterium]|nr:type II 3-dehydroquinate dehydratase [Paludibacteraceae bacterium]
MNIMIINGPNLNLLGKREPTIYGSQSFEEYFDILKEKYPDVNISYYQSNVEGELINVIQETGFISDGIILNAGAYTHTSLAIADAIRAIKCPVVEVHISNTHKREEIRHHSYLTPACFGCILGFGLDSYRLALEALIQINKQHQDNEC